MSPKQEAFFQKPKPTISSDDALWYENKPLGLNKLSIMMKDLLRCWFVQNLYKSLRSCNRHYDLVRCRDSRSSHYEYLRASRPSVQQLERCSDILSSALITTERSSEAHRVMTETMASTISLCTTATPTTSIELSSAAMSFNSLPNTIFNSCRIGNANIYVLPQSNSRF